jgi:hypothetical protein
MKNIVDSEEYKKSRKSVEKYFKESVWRILPWYKPPERKEVIEEFDKYQLIIRNYATRKGCWAYTRGIVTEKSTGQVVADVKRNYSTFPYLFVSHPNGKGYLICGEDYQGYTIVNLSDKITRTFIPEEWKLGGGFCWADHKFDPDDKTLIIEGCYWGAPYEIVTYDFSDPDTLPLKELNRKDAEFEKDDEEEEA